MIEQWILQAALPMGRAYRPWTTVADISQHLWAWATANESRIDEYLKVEGGDKAVRAALHQEARKYAIKERAAVSGYNAEDLAWYTPTALKKILPDVFDEQDWPADSGDRLASIIDVKTALGKLPKDTYDLLRMHYGNTVSVEDCSLALGINEEACRKRLQRGVRALSTLLNNPRPTDPYEGVTYEEWQKNKHFYDTRSKGRKAISNAKARSITEM